MVKNKSGSKMIIIGFLLIFISFSMVCFNYFSVVKAAENIQTALCKLENIIPANSMERFAQKTGTTIEEYGYSNIPQYEINNYSYIGIIRFESLNLSLPILSSSSNKDLDIAPCRQKSSSGLIIEGKNYRSHFAKIDCLLEGDIITFTDTLGKCYNYKVLYSKVIPKHQNIKNTVNDNVLALLKETQFGFKKLAVFCEKI